MQSLTQTNLKDLYSEYTVLKFKVIIQISPQEFGLRYPIVL